MSCALSHGVPPALQGHEKLGSPLDVLDALEACAARGAARALCALAASSFRAATLLGMTCEEAASLGPRQSLQVLLMKGPQAAPVHFCSLCCVCCRHHVAEPSQTHCKVACRSSLSGSQARELSTSCCGRDLLSLGSNCTSGKIVGTMCSSHPRAICAQLCHTGQATPCGALSTPL